MRELTVVYWCTLQLTPSRNCPDFPQVQWGPLWFSGYCLAVPGHCGSPSLLPVSLFSLPQQCPFPSSSSPQIPVLIYHLYIFKYEIALYNIVWVHALNSIDSLYIYMCVCIIYTIYHIILFTIYLYIVFNHTHNIHVYMY